MTGGDGSYARKLSFRLEEHLSHPQLLDYLGGLRGEHQSLCISRNGSPLVAFTGEVGELRTVPGTTVRRPSAPKETDEVTRDALMPIGAGRLEVPAACFTHAARLSRGPAAKAVVIELDDLLVLLHDVVVDLQGCSHG